MRRDVPQRCPGLAMLYWIGVYSSKCSRMTLGAEASAPPSGVPKRHPAAKPLTQQFF